MTTYNFTVRATDAGGLTFDQADTITAVEPFTLASLFDGGIDGGLYIPSPTTCFTDTARTTPAAVGDAVAGVTDLSGNGWHWSQATSAARPILRQDGGGHYYLELDAVDDWIGSAGTYTITEPHWVAACFSKGSQNAFGLFGAASNGTNYHRIGNQASAFRVVGAARSTAAGLSSVATPNNGFLNDVIRVADSLLVVGTTDLKIDNTTAIQSANTWASGASTGLGAIGLNLNLASSGSINPQNFYGGLVLKANPGANRAAAATLLGQLAGLTI